MVDLIDRQKLLKKKQYSFQTENGAFPRHDYFIKISDIRSMSTVDMQRHAHWIKEKVEDITYPWYRRFCSNCKRWSPLGREHNYCPNCGCKMDEKEEQ